jgi:hypothetical protein
VNTQPLLNPTLLQLTKSYENGSFEIVLSPENQFTLVEQITAVASSNPLLALELTLTLQKVLDDRYDLALRFVAPAVQDIPDDNMPQLREATAFIAGMAINVFRRDGAIVIDPSDGPTIGALAFLFKKLSRVKGQKEQVRELADAFLQAYGVTACDNIPPIVPLLPFTTVGQASIAAAKRDHAFT